MHFDYLLIEDRDAVRIVTINRPDKLNALNRGTLLELQRAFDACREDDAVRVVVLRGAGSKAFVAGADIAELAALKPIQARDFSRLGQRLMRTIEGLGKPVIAMIGGYALGGGMELAMACHLRLAADNAKFGQPEINLGTLPGFGGTQRLLRLAGRGAALELCLAGAPIGAQRAYELGLIHRIAIADQLETETMTLATQFSNAAPQALRGILDAVLVGGECGIEAGLDYETHAFALCATTDDMHEGTQAFLQRRKPVFRGH
jgi:enoyl-CoA hydratase